MYVCMYKNIYSICKTPGMLVPGGLLTFARCCDVVLLIFVSVLYSILTVDTAFVSLPGDSKI